MSNVHTPLPEAAAPAPISFSHLGLHDAVLQALTEAGYAAPTPVQAAAIPPALAGADLMVSSATGSGKTAAFVLPFLHRLAHSDSRAVPGQGPRVLVLTPTRELSSQVTRACDTYGKALRWLRTATVVGGVAYGAQLKAVRGQVDVLIATPGRLLDLLDGGRLSLSRVEVLVLDEADRMLDMGFVDDIQAIARATPATRQTLLFSATLDDRTDRLARGLMNAPRRLAVAPSRERQGDITQRLHWADSRSHKQALLDRLLRDKTIDQAIVFTSTQVDAERLAASLADAGHPAAALHGGMPQGQRTRTMTALRQRRLRVLVATDVAARGIDVATVSHVINYGLPMRAEDYVHRIGRTGRAGRTGLAVTLAEHSEASRIRSIERFTRHPIPVETLSGLEPRRAAAPTARRGAQPRSRTALADDASRAGFGRDHGRGAQHKRAR
jgi:superfamily II DNA/RNA helicase